MELLMPTHTSVGNDNVVDVEFLKPTGEPAIVVAFNAHTVVVQFEIKTGARVKQTIVKDLSQI
jgi:hypothetical protein